MPPNIARTRSPGTDDPAPGVCHIGDMLEPLRPAGLLLIPGAIPAAAGTAIPPSDSCLSAGKESAVAEILNSQDWNDLRAAWAGMTAVAQPDSSQWYMGVLDDSEGGRIRAGIESCFDRLSDADSPVSAEMAVVRRLFMLRLRTLMYGSRSMYTRMIVPAVQMESEQAFISFENRLDAVEEMRSRGLIGTIKASDAAMAALETGIAALLLDTMSAPRLYIWNYDEPGARPPWELVQMRLAEIRIFADTSLAGLESRLIASEAVVSVDSIISMLPGICLLVSDLICAR